MNRNYQLYKWPRVHEHVIQQCSALVVADVLGYLDRWHRAVLSTWSPPTHPGLRLVMRYGGPFRRWWFVCPGCQRHCEALYVPPDARPDDWRCRLCHDLIYASQRYGHRHPLRRRLTHRRTTAMRKDVLRQQRAAARQQWRQHQRPQPSPEAVATAERAIAALERLDAALAPPGPEGAEGITARLNAEAAPTLAALRQLAVAPSARVRAGARRTLGRLGRA